MPTARLRPRLRPHAGRRSRSSANAMRHTPQRTCRPYLSCGKVLRQAPAARGPARRRCRQAGRCGGYPPTRQRRPAGKGGRRNKPPNPAGRSRNSATRRTGATPGRRRCGHAPPPGAGCRSAPAATAGNDPCGKVPHPAVPAPLRSGASISGAAYILRGKCTPEAPTGSRIGREGFAASWVRVLCQTKIRQKPFNTNFPGIIRPPCRRKPSRQDKPNAAKITAKCLTPC